MAILAPLFALVGRFVGRVLTTTLGWASVLLFGRVPQDRQVWLAVLTFGSLAWVAAMAGILVPDVGAFLLTALPTPDWIDDDLVRLAMLAVALLLPAALGAVTLLLFEPADRPHGAGQLAQLLRGYALAPTLAGTLVVLAVAGVVRKLRTLVARRTDAHVAMVVRPDRYDALVDDLESHLRRSNLVARRRAGSRVLTVPAKALAAIAGRSIGRFVPDRLIELDGAALTVAVYPSDLAMNGREREVALARATITRDVRSVDAWFTTSKEAQELEDELARLERGGPPSTAALATLDGRLLRLTVGQEEWEVLYRRRLQLVADSIPDVGEARRRHEPGVDAAPARRARERHVSVGAVAGAALFVLVAADLLLAVLASVSRPARGTRA